jgi:hypothetical protein
MEKVFGLRCILAIFLTTIDGVQLQEEFWNSGFWVPDSKIVFSPPLLFPSYRTSQRGHGNLIKNTAPPHAGVNVDYNETGTSRDSKKIYVLADDSKKEMQNHSDSNDDTTRVLLNEHEGYNENGEYDTRKSGFNNITWNIKLGKSRLRYYESDFGLDISGYKLNEPNRVENLSDIGSRTMENYGSDSDTQMLGHQANDPNVSAGHTLLVKHNGHEHLPREGYSQLEHKKGDSTKKKPVKQNNDFNGNIARQETTEDERDGSLQSIQDFERNYFSGFDISRERQVRDRYGLGRNHFSDVTRQRGFGTGREDNQVQRRYDSERSLYNIIAWHSDSDRSKVTKNYTQDDHDLRRNNFDFDKRHSDSDNKSEKATSKHEDGFGTHFTGDTWNSDIGTGSDEFRISGENQDSDKVQHPQDLVRSPFGDDIWPSDTYTITEGQHISKDKQESVSMQATFDSGRYNFSEEERNGNYGTAAVGNHGPRQDEFNIQRNRFGDIMWHNGYSSGSGSHLPELKQVYEPYSNQFTGTSWQSDYSLGGERQYVPTYEEAGGERTNNQYISEAMPLHHGGHPLRTGTRVATGPPTAVISYMLPNGTKVVRLRRIVLYRKPQTSSQEESPRTFTDIAKGIIQKKVAKRMYTMERSNNGFDVN